MIRSSGGSAAGCPLVSASSERPHGDADARLDPPPASPGTFGSGSTGRRTGLVTQGRAHCQGEKGGVGLGSRLSLRQIPGS